MAGTRLVDGGLTASVSTTAIILAAAGAYFRLDDASGPITVELIDDQDSLIGELRNLQAGSGIETQRRFHRARITSATSQTITYTVGESKLQVDRIAGNVTSEETPANGITNVAKTTVGTTKVTLTAPADAVALMLKAAKTNTGTIYLGDDYSTPDGYPLDAGEAVTLPVSCNVDLISDTAAQAVHVTWLTRA